MSFEEYLTIDEVAARLEIKSKTVRNKCLQAFSEKECITFTPKVWVHCLSGLLSWLGWRVKIRLKIGTISAGFRWRGDISWVSLTGASARPIRENRRDFRRVFRQEFRLLPCSHLARVVGSTPSCLAISFWLSPRALRAKISRSAGD
jgi:hypothetical protein